MKQGSSLENDAATESGGRSSLNASLLHGRRWGASCESQRVDQAALRRLAGVRWLRALWDVRGAIGRGCRQIAIVRLLIVHADGLNEE